MQNYNVVLNNYIISKIEEDQRKAALATANSIILDVNAAQTVPYDTSALEASAFPLQDTTGNVEICYSTPYAARQYFDASLDHSKGPHAGTATDHWLQPYLNGGTKQKWVIDKFVAHFKNFLRR